MHRRRRSHLCVISSFGMPAIVHEEHLFLASLPAYGGGLRRTRRECMNPRWTRLRVGSVRGVVFSEQIVQRGRVVMSETRCV